MCKSDQTGSTHVHFVCQAIVRRRTTYYVIDEEPEKGPL